MTVRPASLRLSDTQFTQATYDLKNLVCNAQICCKMLEELGFKSRIVTVDGSPPCVIAQRIIAQVIPAIAFIAHYDAKQTSAAVEEKDGRLYGTGVCEGKGGMVVFLSALSVYKDANKCPPANLKILLMADSMSASHRAQLLKLEKESLKAAAFIPLIGSNIDKDTGTLLFSTRGIAKLNLRVDALKAPIPSDSAFLVPDPAMYLSELLASLKGAEALQLLKTGFNPLMQIERSLLKGSSPSTPDVGSHSLGLLPTVFPRIPMGTAVYESIAGDHYYRVLSLEAHSPEGDASLIPFAKAIVEIRTLPFQYPETVASRIKQLLEKLPNYYNLKTTVEISEAGPQGWKSNLFTPLAEAFQSALKENFRKFGALPLAHPVPLISDLRTAFPAAEIIVPGLKTESPDFLETVVFRRSIDTLIAFIEKVGDLALNL